MAHVRPRQAVKPLQKLAKLWPVVGLGWIETTLIRDLARAYGKALGWEEKSLLGAIKKLRSKQGLISAPIEKSDPLKRSGITRVSWLHFSTSPP